MYTVYLGLGSNIGDRFQYLSASLNEILRFMRVLSVSPVYETEPVEMGPGDNFLNIVIKAETNLVPSDLLPKLKVVEKHLGRSPDTHMRPREIDIDVLLYEGETYRDEHIEVPHPRLAQRRFVLAPFNDIAPEVLHPVLNKSVKQLLEACTDKNSVVRTVHKITIPQLT
jgi:2-amino-4-hydroxy-6-hydroxymethyldihydropteridine diphosphokinase